MKYEYFFSSIPDNYIKDEKKFLEIFKSDVKSICSYDISKSNEKEFKSFFRQLSLKQIDRTQQIKEAHPWLSYEEAVKVLLYHHKGSMWIHNLQRDKIKRSMEAFAKLLKSKKRKPLNLLYITF